MKECASHGKPLLISAREVTSLTVKTIGQVKFMGNSRNPLSQFFRAKSIDTPKKEQVFLDAHMAIQRKFLRDIPNMGPCLCPGLPQVDARHRKKTACCWQ